MPQSLDRIKVKVKCPYCQFVITRQRERDFSRIGEDGKPGWKLMDHEHCHNCESVLFFKADNTFDREAMEYHRLIEDDNVSWNKKMERIDDLRKKVGVDRLLQIQRKDFDSDKPPQKCTREV